MDGVRQLQETCDKFAKLRFSSCEKRGKLPQASYSLALGNAGVPDLWLNTAEIQMR
jgi:hypothetical protein